MTVVHHNVWKRRFHFHAQGPHDPVVAAVALQDDPGQVGQRLAAGLAQLSSESVSPSRLEIGKPAAGDGFERSQDCGHMFRIAPNAVQNARIL